MNDDATGPVATSITTTCVAALSEYVQTTPELPAGRSSGGCDIGAATDTPSPALMTLSLGQVRPASAEVGVAVGAAVGMAVEGGAVDDVVDDVVDVGVELPHASSVAASATGTTEPRRSSVRML